jgi:hypothetical protein
MNSSLDGLLIAAVIALSAVLGGGMYEHLVIDASWPERPDLIQPKRGGVRRGRFWLPAHLLFEVLLLSSLAVSWKLPTVRLWLLATMGIHIATRLWSAFDFIPKALAFEKADVVDETLAKRWAFKSKFRLPLELLTLALLMNALHVAFER